MILLVLGLLLWSGAHLAGRIVPDRRAGLGDAGRGLVAVAVLAGLGLMVAGYRMADFVPLWYPPRGLVHLNNLLMIVAFYLFAASHAKTRITRVIRHPQLTAVKIWATGHLLVNGDLASVVLFGGLLAWAVASVVLINRTSPGWTPPPPAAARKEIVAVAAAVVVLLVAMVIHNWLGVRPW